MILSLPQGLTIFDEAAHAALKSWPLAVAFMSSIAAPVTKVPHGLLYYSNARQKFDAAEAQGPEHKNETRKGVKFAFSPTTC
jgi:hypothetical protein